MPRLLLILALVPMLLPPGVCACGAAVCCAAEAGGDGHDHDCPDAPHAALLSAGGDRVELEPACPHGEHAPSCPAVGDGGRQLLPARAKSPDLRVIAPVPAGEFVTRHAAAAAALPTSPSSLSGRPLFLTLRALLI